MKLIVGLGNPGSKYENTRHNAGFMTVDALANKYNGTFNLEGKLNGMISFININGNKVLLLKPMTFMNLSGESVIKVMNYYKISSEDIIVISDDLDSRLGRVRIRANGSAGGHNGHKNIIAHIKTEEYKRIKIGIDRDPNIAVVDWVLKKFTNDEMAIMNQAIDRAIPALEDFVCGVDFSRIASIHSSK